MKISPTDQTVPILWFQKTLLGQQVAMKVALEWRRVFIPYSYFLFIEPFTADVGLLIAGY